MADLSVIIPARNEEFLRQTIENVLANMRGDTEIIAVLDGAWAEPPIKDDKRVTLVYHPQSVGQRAGINEAARISRAEYVMKLDAHCSVSEGFDVELMRECGDDWIVVPRMYNLHAFDWVCDECGTTRYQGHKLGTCKQCGREHEDWHKVMRWRAKPSPTSDFMRFDADLRFKYWGKYKRRPEAQGDICDLMCFIGAGWMLRRDWYWEIGGCDEGHGSWGQQGVEMACKGWLSGGRVVVNKRAWFAHMFRTQGGDFGFPYPLSGKATRAARRYSRWLWRGGNWERAVHPLSWLVEKFWPVEGWTDEDLAELKREEAQ
jgi:glycosyltransferase involved in cell wall biosynthesis